MPKKKITLEYDTASMNITDANGMHIACLGQVESFEAESLSVKEVCELKEAGFTAEEIIEMNKKEVFR